jgi:hypothetical protein
MEAAAAAAVSVAARRRRKQHEEWLARMQRRITTYEWLAKIAEARARLAEAEARARRFEHELPGARRRQGRSRSSADPSRCRDPSTDGKARAGG